MCHVCVFKKPQILLLIKPLRTFTQIVRLSVRNLVLTLFKFQNVRQVSSTWKCPRAGSQAGASASLSLPTGGRGEPRRGEDPGVRVAEEGGAGAQPVLCGRAGARGEGLGLGGLPERCEFASRSSSASTRQSVPVGTFGQKENARVLEGQPAPAEPRSAHAKGPSLPVSAPHPWNEAWPPSLRAALTPRRSNERATWGGGRQAGRARTRTGDVAVTPLTRAARGCRACAFVRPRKGRVAPCTCTSCPPARGGVDGLARSSGWG